MMVRHTEGLAFLMPMEENDILAFLVSPGVGQDYSGTSTPGE